MQCNISDSQALFKSFFLIILRMVSLDNFCLCSVGQQAWFCFQFLNFLPKSRLLFLSNYSYIKKSVLQQGTPFQMLDVGATLDLPPSNKIMRFTNDTSQRFCNDLLFSIYCTKLLITDIVKLYQILQMAILHAVK